MELPKRNHDLKIHVGADDLEGVIRSLNDIIFDLRRGSQRCVSGGCSAGYSYDLVIDAEMTNEKYHELNDKYLEATI